MPLLLVVGGGRHRITYMLTDRGTRLAFIRIGLIMPLIYDNLVSMVIATTVTLILASVQLRAMKHQVAGTAHYVMTQRATQLSSWLQDDLARIGKNQAGGDTPIDTLIVPTDDSTAQWLTTQFVFERDSISPSGNTVPVKVRYDIQPTGTRSIAGKTRPVYQLDRDRKVGASAWTSTGGSAAELGYFDVDLLNKNATPVENPQTHLQSHPDTVRSVRVRFSVLPPFQNDQLPIATSRANTVVASYPAGGP